jgi:hypothetical protein
MSRTGQCAGTLPSSLPEIDGAGKGGEKSTEIATPPGFSPETTLFG